MLRPVVSASSLIFLVAACAPSAEAPPAAASPIVAPKPPYSPMTPTITASCPGWMATPPVPNEQTFSKACSTDADCAVGFVVSSCCGQGDRIVGVAKGDKQRLDTCSRCPALACAKQGPTAEDGSPVGELAAVTVACVEGACTTRAR
jgi:hypothetical protein